MTAPTRIRTQNPAVAVARHLPVGRVIAASLATGAGSAAVVVFCVLPSAPEATIVGAALIAFAMGWAMLALLTARSTAVPQPWALVPAASLAVAGLGLLVAGPGEPTMTQLAWVWAPALVALGLFVALRSRHNVPGRGAMIVYPAAIAMMAAGAGGLYQAATPSPETAAGAMPGRLVDVGGYRLHLSCSGTGSPTVVLLNGLGETSPQWERVNPTIARTTRVCVYDRAGQGWSDDSASRADTTSAITDLHRLLSGAGEIGPFVLAGHSLGGVHALAYAAAFPTDVAGVVLLDSASPHQVDLVKPFTGEYELMRRVLAVLPTLFRFGIGQATRAITPSTPGTASAQASAFANSPRGMRNMRAEQEALPDSFAQAQALTTLGGTPLVVLTAKDNVERKPGWAAAQDQLARLSTNSRHTVADLDHMAFLDDAAGAALSVEAINDVVASVRSHEPVRA
ncbi:MAG TPA: alpha/beta fold hydrolase [Propionicimonas sp.]